MPQGPFPRDGQDGQEPERSTPPPDREDGAQAPAAGAGPVSGAGPGGGRPGGSGGPDEGWDEVPPGGPGQGLFVCLPAENMELSRFGGDDQRPPMAPGPLLAGVAYAVAGSDGAGLAGVSEDFLFAVISGGRRMASWATWLEFSAMRELALRHPAVPASSRPQDPSRHPRTRRRPR